MSEHCRVLGCDCADSFQDARYGAGMRVHNQTKQSKSEKERRWKCIRCGRER